MGDIGKIVKEVTFEPIDQPSAVPEPAPTTSPAPPVKTPVPA